MHGAPSQDWDRPGKVVGRAGHQWRVCPHAPRCRSHRLGPALGVSVVGNHLVDASGNPLLLHGVNRSGTEYACVQGWGIFDGPSDAASVRAIAAWHTNVVRVPLNEDCWLGINGVAPSLGGAAYQKAIVDYVNLLNQNGLYAIVELHLSAPGTTAATGQSPMPDQDHSPAFWSGVASTFKTNKAVIFDLFNEPYPDDNRDTTAAWTCWKNGGTCSGVSYPAAGMQTLVNAVRSTGATNVIMLGGVQYAGTLDQWHAYAPTDSAGQLAASFHTYNFTGCTTATCWTSWLASVGGVPLITGEIGETDGASTYIGSYMVWADAHAVSYLAWVWDTWGCGANIALITDYSGTPCQTYGSGYKNHLALLAMVPGAPTGVTASPGSTASPSTGPIVVSYTTPPNHGSAIMKYTATCTSSDGGPSRTFVHSGATAAPITVGGATLKKTYTCTVTATNAKGTGPASSASAAIVVGAPARVGRPAVAKVASGKLNVSFTALSAAQANGSPLTTPEYTAVCKSSNGGAAKSATGTASPIAVAALTAGRSYTCTVDAHNARGYGLASAASTVVAA